MIYLLVEIMPMRQEATQQNVQAPLNLTLVLDRSTSMKGRGWTRSRLRRTRSSISFRRMMCLSVVSFSDRAEVLIPARTVQRQNLAAGDGQHDARRRRHRNLSRPGGRG